MTTGIQSNVIAYVYYYPPQELTQAVTTTISSEIGNALGSSQGISNIYLDPDTQLVIIQFTSIYGVPGLGTTSYTIYVTPQAFTSWYTNNLPSLSEQSIFSNVIKPFYTQMIASIGSFANQEAFTQNFINVKGWTWVPYTVFSTQISSYQTNGALNGPSANTVQGSDTTQEYALVAQGVQQSLVNGILPQVSTLDWELLAGSIFLIALVYIVTR